MPLKITKTESYLIGQTFWDSVDWDIGAATSPTREFETHAWRMVDPYLRQYFDTGTADLRTAVDFVLSWARWNKNNKTRYSWQDAATGIRSLRLSFFIDVHRSGELPLTEAELSEILDLSRLHVDALLAPGAISKNNHGLFQIAGLRQLSRRIFDSVATEASADYLRVLLQQLYTPAGIFKEHSPYYQLFFANTARDLDIVSLFPEVNEAADLLARSASTLPWFVFPNREIARIGDSLGNGPVASLEGVGDFTSSGYAIVRTSTSMLIVTCGSWSVSHKHADDLSFELYEGGKRVLVDCGKYCYKKDDARKFFLSGAAHNTVDLKGSSTSPIKAYGSGLRPVTKCGDAYTIEGAVTYPQFKHHRVFTYVPGKSLNIRDTLTSAVERTFISRLHPHYTCAVSPRNQNAYSVDNLTVASPLNISRVASRQSPTHETIVDSVALATTARSTSATMQWDIEIR